MPIYFHFSHLPMLKQSMLELSLFTFIWDFYCSELSDNLEGESAAKGVDGDDVRPPLPVIRDVLYDNVVSFGYVIYINFVLRVDLNA